MRLEKIIDNGKLKIENDLDVDILEIGEIEEICKIGKIEEIGKIGKELWIAEM